MTRDPVYYLHTLDGKPAWFDGEQIVYAEQHPHWMDNYTAAPLCTSARQIKAEQKRSREFRAQHGWPDDRAHGWVVVAFRPVRMRRRVRA